MQYFAYENWRADGHKVTVHQTDCRFCNHGLGLAGGTRKDNGKWIDLGSHSSRNAAITQAKNITQAPLIKLCTFCDSLFESIMDGAVLGIQELKEPLIELGRRWAGSKYRPQPKQSILEAWDNVLNAWTASDLPLVLRDSRRRGEVAECANGRKVFFADNTPANWVFGLALEDIVPEIELWTTENIKEFIPLTFLTKGNAAKRDLNKRGWKVCHIEAVSDRKRYRIEDAPFYLIEAEFRRFLSPRNIFLIPKPISGAGELPEVVSAIVVYNANNNVSG